MSTCLRCLARLSINTSRDVSGPSLVRPLSTSASRHAQSARPGAEARGKKTLKLGKRKVESKGRAPNPGERKAIRKRIVLSNTNAFEVEDLKDWSADNYADEQNLGTVVALPGPVVDSLRAIESFQASQCWSFFRRPATLLRKETLDIGKYMQNLAQGGDKGALRKLIVGDRGSGKSVLLLQAQTMAFQSGWIVFHMPECKSSNATSTYSLTCCSAQDITNATTEYAPLEGTNPRKFVQRTCIAQLLGRIAKANKTALSKLQLSQKHQVPFPVQENMSLDRFAELGAQDPDASWPIFTALWKELQAPGRPPILYTLDNIAHVARLSSYLTPDMYNIHACDLAILDHFVSHLSGSQPLQNGGIVLAADSESNRPKTAGLDLAIKQSEAAGQGAARLPLFDSASPYEVADPRVVELFRAVEVMRLKGLNTEEAKTLLEYYSKSGMLRQSVTQGLVTERLSMSGGGIVGELERTTIRNHA